jgi:trans-2,3-dihydro-3-hydroxyanthranilate isomerase
MMQRESSLQFYGATQHPVSNNESNMKTYPYRLVNVFAESTFGGNPLCVFESGEGLSDDEMQALALQFNLSETTFILPSSQATARVRIFTPTFEMAFAGHPTLGTAHVVRALKPTGASNDAVTLEMKAGVIPVSAAGDRWELRANSPEYRDLTLSKAELANILGLHEGDILNGARWVNTGSEQLIVPLASIDAITRAAPDAARLAHIVSSTGRTRDASMAYVFAENPDGVNDGRGRISLRSRFFFLKHTSVIEDPGTGSATANLGGWMLGRDRAVPIAFLIEQGAQVNRPCHLGLRIDKDKQIFVSGQVIEIGRGTITLP